MVIIFFYASHPVLLYYLMVYFILPSKTQQYVYDRRISILIMAIINVEILRSYMYCYVLDGNKICYYGNYMRILC